MLFVLLLALVGIVFIWAGLHDQNPLDVVKAQLVYIGG